jgi:ABC-2 type transport system permease protein
LLVSPFPRSFLLLSKLLGGVAVALLQVFAFLAVAYVWGISPPSIDTLKLFTAYESPDWLGLGAMSEPIIQDVVSVPTALQPYIGYITVIPALVIVGLMLGSLALFMSSVIKQLENFAGVMNFVIFPMFFASSALYPLWRIRESSPALFEICRFNPFTYCVELIRFALYGQVDVVSLIIVVACTVLFLAAAVYAYNPSKGLIARRGGPGGGA